MQIDTQNPVAVTGANGYVASWLVKDLLEAGVTVHATVRDPNNAKKTGHLTTIAENSAGALKLFAADLLDKDGFDEAIAGCSIVFHTASPFVIAGITDPDKQLVQPALQGTRNVLQAVNRNDSVKRVVLTSSVAAIYGDAADMKNINADAFNETHWNTSSSLSHQPYSYSKKAAEELAWDICRQQDHWDLVVINPGLVFGPSLTNASDSTSISMIKNLLTGKLRTGVPNLEFAVIDVRDISTAHMKAAFTPTANGRHAIVSETVSFLEMAKMIERKWPKRFKLPKGHAPKLFVWLAGPSQGAPRKFVSRNVGFPLKFDTTRAKTELGMTFRSANDSIIEHVEQWLESNPRKSK